MGYTKKTITQTTNKPCECCKTFIKVNLPFESWKQYCVSCFGRKGNDLLDIIPAGTNQYGYTYYKTVAKKKPLTGFMFLDDRD